MRVRYAWIGSEKELMETGMWEHIPYDDDDSVPLEGIRMMVKYVIEDGIDVIYFYVWSETYDTWMRLPDQTIIRHEDPEEFETWVQWLIAKAEIRGEKGC